ncbi:uncharacterized protein LOC125497514 isoform X4 [Beta vulgaris subsp. vulgaris]|uniref:uncharacterized protein LOC125497514 isoform X4 n=1 Tax=Beta vulgaris subsp. vulgaris TaxID=3555 RepID=UPI002036D1E0|nr:uncharacterized protein LOC125497514 isoform X4 [Beta vulgaris subsp. vulgaris]
MENKAFVLFVLGFTFVHCVLSIPASNPRSLRISKQSLVHDLLADTPKVVTLAVQELTHKHSEEASYKWKTFTGQTRMAEKGYQF